MTGAEAARVLEAARKRRSRRVIGLTVLAGVLAFAACLAIGALSGARFSAWAIGGVFLGVAASLACVAAFIVDPASQPSRVIARAIRADRDAWWAVSGGRKWPPDAAFVKAGLPQPPRGAEFDFWNARLALARDDDPSAQRMADAWLTDDAVHHFWAAWLKESIAIHAGPQRNLDALRASAAALPPSDQERALGLTAQLDARNSVLRGQDPMATLTTYYPLLPSTHPSRRFLTRLMAGVVALAVIGLAIAVVPAGG